MERLSTNAVFPDFNNDGSADLLLRNRNTGVIGTWFLNGADVVGGVTFSQIPPATYNLIGVGDFRSDGSSTPVFQDSADNRVVFWYTGGTSPARTDSARRARTTGHAVARPTRPTILSLKMARR